MSEGTPNYYKDKERIQGCFLKKRRTMEDKKAVLTIFLSTS